MSQWECNCDVTSISTGNLNEDNNTEIIIGTDQSNWVNGTRGVQGYIHVIDSTTFTNKWVSSNIGIVHEIFIPDLSAQTNMVVFSGDTITIFSTSDIPQENNSSNETPGFEISQPNYLLPIHLNEFLFHFDYNYAKRYFRFPAVALSPGLAHRVQYLFFH